MKVGAYIPSVPEISREAIIVMAGALIAVLIVKQLPAKYQSWFSLGSAQQ